MIGDCPDFAPVSYTHLDVYKRQSPGGPKARFALNTAAIGTLRRIEDEGRMATAEERCV